jgi:hypothetical protein
MRHVIHIAIIECRGAVTSPAMIAMNNMAALLAPWARRPRL